MRTEIPIQRVKLQQIILNLYNAAGKSSGAKLAFHTIDLSKIEAESAVSVLESIEDDIQEAIKELSKEFYQKPE